MTTVNSAAFKAVNKLYKITYRSSEEVLHMLGSILNCLQRGRTILLVPRKRTMEDLMNSKNMVCFVIAGVKILWFSFNSILTVVCCFQKSLAPPLPNEVAVSFYIQSHKLVFAVYQVSMIHGALKFDTSQAECSVPWLNEVLVLLTVGLQTCQQLKDKVSYNKLWLYSTRQ